MKKLILSLIFLVSGLAHAGSYSDFYSHCVLNKQGKFKYEIDPLPDFGGLYTPSGFFNRMGHATVSGVIRGSTRIYDEARDVVSVMTRNEFIKGKNIRRWTIETIKKEILKYRLNTFEKLSLINCATFMLIDYKMNMSTKLGSVLEIYEKGQGICTEMTEVSLDLARAVGIKGRSMISDKEHNWPEYKINGTWYIIDPTSNSFQFYESLKQ